MILNSKSILAGAMLIGLGGVAHAAPMWSISTEGVSGAIDAEATFLSSLHSGSERTEDFDTGYTVGDQSVTIDTSANGNVGTFTMNTPTDRGDTKCSTTYNGFTYVCEDGLAVLNENASPFNGRYPMPGGPDDESGQWLDSMDAKLMTFNVASGFNAVGFYITDANDVNAMLDIDVMVNGQSAFNIENIIGTASKGGAATGEVYYISIWDYNSDINSLAFVNNGNNDGFGIDRVSIGRVPEPGTMALLALGIAGLGAARRRQKAA